jgi:hypothetical protein
MDDVASIYDDVAGTVGIQVEDPYRYRWKTGGPVKA